MQSYGNDNGTPFHHAPFAGAFSRLNSAKNIANKSAILKRAWLELMCFDVLNQLLCYRCSLCSVSRKGRPVSRNVKAELLKTERVRKASFDLRRMAHKVE